MIPTYAVQPGKGGIRAERQGEEKDIVCVDGGGGKVLAQCTDKTRGVVEAGQGDDGTTSGLVGFRVGDGERETVGAD